jgi:hypothetical protein
MSGNATYQALNPDLEKFGLCKDAQHPAKPNPWFVLSCPNSLTDELRHAIREVVHRTGDLDRSFVLQILQYWASPRDLGQVKAQLAEHHVSVG